MGRVAEVHASGRSFILVRHRGSAVFIVPVRSTKGAAFLIFGAKVRSRGKRWWFPTLALAGRALERFNEGVGEVASEGRGAAAFRSKKSGMFVKVSAEGGGGRLIVGQGSRAYVSVELSRGDLARLTSLLHRARSWEVADLPLPLTWRAKEEIFGPTT